MTAVPVTCIDGGKAETYLNLADPDTRHRKQPAMYPWTGSPRTTTAMSTPIGNPAAPQGPHRRRLTTPVGKGQD